MTWKPLDSAPGDLLAVPAPVRIESMIGHQLAAALHDASVTARHKGSRGEAIKLHLKSLVQPGGWRYLGYTRHLVLPDPQFILEPLLRAISRPESPYPPMDVHLTTNPANAKLYQDGHLLGDAPTVVRYIPPSNIKAVWPDGASMTWDGNLRVGEAVGGVETLHATLSRPGY